ncbi:MAG: DUF5615 family PIN-like protein [Actinomycetota bacterium]|nr:DUF5615 family PIN-like protein [Actinomycetota bacterium]
MRLLLDELFSPNVAEGLRRRGIDALSIQASPHLRGLPDDQVFVIAQLDRRVLVTESIADFVIVESAWRAEHEKPHHGLVFVAPGSFTRHKRGAIGQLVIALARLAEQGGVDEGTVSWLIPQR